MYPGVWTIATMRRGAIRLMVMLVHHFAYTGECWAVEVFRWHHGRMGCRGAMYTFRASYRNGLTKEQAIAHGRTLERMALGRPGWEVAR
jgi:hypothetical protein